MSNGNLSIWDKLKTPPPEALKPIKGGRLKGMTDISPQWRYQALTEEFGPCGVGWKYEITKLWMEPDSNGLIAVFATIDFQFKHDDDWSEKIPGIGGSMFVAKETAGPYTTDEAYKMAVTDALSVATKMIGVASDVYMGNMDGSKYRDQEKLPPCPKCGKSDPVINGKEEYGGGFVCWKGKDGCGHKWQAKKEDTPPEPENRNQSEKKNPDLTELNEAKLDVDSCRDKVSLDKWIGNNKQWIDSLSEEYKEEFRNHCQQYYDMFKK